MKPALHELFSYLSEEVFQNMSEQEQNWLLSFSIFPVISNQLAIDFFGNEAADRLSELLKSMFSFSHLAKKELFVTMLFSSNFLKQNGYQ